MKILEEIKPNKKETEKTDKELNSFIQELERYLVDCKIVAGGSFAKDTWLKGAHDIDLFVKFPYKKYKDKNISENLKERIRDFNFQIIHGSRDYFQVKRNGFKFELIPVLNIKNIKEAKNITDISPFHTIWVRENAGNTDEIRLAKKFLKENNLYGAETHIKGFSGYTIEILVIYYKTFFNFVKNASEWKNKNVIDIKNYYKDKKLIFNKINKSKLSNLIVIDPIDKNRNTSAALSGKNYFRFIRLCKDYLKNPNEEFFKRKKINFKLLKEDYRNSRIAILKIKSLKEKEDIAGAKILKVLDYIDKKLKEEGFTVYDYDIRWNEKIRAWFILKDEKLSEYKKHYGPPIREELHLRYFKEKWKNYKIKEDGNKVYVEIKRKNRELKGFLRNLVKNDDLIKQNVRKIKVKVI